MLLQARSLDVHFGQTHAVRGATVTVQEGESVALVGRSGSGKSTMLFCLAGLLRPGAGSVLFNGVDYSTLSDEKLTALRGKNFGFVFQFAELVPELTLRENIALPAELAGWKRQAVAERVAELAGRLGLEQFLARLPEELSGGQAQRGAVARAVVHRPSVVFADEPTGSLDTESAAGVIGLLLEQTRHDGAALVVVTHDPGVASLLGRLVEMADGELVG
jgi:putative ABC transport system ATP-binding protein